MSVHDRSSGADATETHRAVEAVWRIESARIIAGMARMVGDIGLAEEFAQDALVAALEQWPRTGIPRNTGAWLTAAAKRRAIDHWRRQERLGNKYRELAHRQETDEPVGQPEVMVVDNPIDDDLLGLIFVSCHPVLSRQARVSLTLRLLGGLTTDEIARAFLVPSATIGQRIVRAKKTLSAANVPFEVPGHDEFAGRLDSVLEVIYLVFNEGYAATAGDDWMRPELCQEAMRLGRVLAELVPRESEVHGLVALMELQSSRIHARASRDGDPILLMDQDRSRWDQLLIRRGLAALGRSESLGGARGMYALQAAIAGCHARASSADDTDWERIVALYDALAQVYPSPVVDLNRAVAVSMAYGAAAGLEIVDELVEGGGLDEYHLLPSVRGDLLQKLGRVVEARAEFERAASMTRNDRERALLLDRASASAG